MISSHPYFNNVMVAIQSFGSDIQDDDMTFTLKQLRDAFWKYNRHAKIDDTIPVETLWAIERLLKAQNGK